MQVEITGAPPRAADGVTTSGPVMLGCVLTFADGVLTGITLDREYFVKGPGIVLQRHAGDTSNPNWPNA
jgi:hypothetical protein